MLRASFVTTPLLLAALAGCLGGAPPSQAPDGSLTSGGAAHDAGSILGLVVDDAELPLPGAMVGILQTELVALTDDGGRFGFNDLAAGTYTLAAQRLGHESSLLRITVSANQEARVVMTLKPIAIEDAFHEIHGPFVGYFDCRLGIPTQTGACGSVLAVGFRADEYWPNDRAFHGFNMSAAHWRTFVGELEWQRGTAATSTSLRGSFSHDDRTSSHWWCSGEGPSPLQWRFEKLTADGSPQCHGASRGSESQWPEPTPELALHHGVRVPFGTTQEPVFLAFQQRFESYVSIFYAEPAPQEFTALADR